MLKGFAPLVIETTTDLKTIVEFYFNTVILKINVNFLKLI